MGYDPFSPVAPALINVLCVPAGRIKSCTFYKYLEWLRAVASVVSHHEQALGNTESTGSRSASHGTVLLFNFDGHSDADTLLSDTFFEPNRQPCTILGVLDGSSFGGVGADHASMIKQAQAGLRQSTQQRLAPNTPVKTIIFDTAVPISIDDVICVPTTPNESSTAVFCDWLLSAALSINHKRLEDLKSQDVELPRSRHVPDQLSGAEPRWDSKADDVRRQSVLTSLSRIPTEAPSIPMDDAQITSSGKIISAALLKLQIGLWSEALEQFADGARIARDANSPAWHAKALEGVLVCTILLAWAKNDFQVPQDCYPTSRGLSSSSAVHSIADSNRAVSERFAASSTNRLQGLTAMLTGLLATIMNLYDRSLLGFENALPQLLVCEARVRMARVLVIVRKAGCLVDEEALKLLVGSPEKATGSAKFEPPTVPMVLRSSALGSLLIESIVEAEGQLPIQSAAPVYLAVCQSLSDLDLERKQGFYLKDILQRLPPALVDARRVGAAAVAVHSPTGGSNVAAPKHRGHSRIAQGVRSVLDLAVRVYGLPDLVADALSLNQADSRVRIRRRLSSWLSAFLSGDIATKLEVLRLCVRVSDALPDMVGSVRFMSLLLFLARQTITVSKGLGNSVPLIATEEQTRLANGIGNAVQAGQRHDGKTILAQYWDDFLVRGIESYEHPSAGKLVLHASQDLSHTTISGAAIRDPFIYNPFSEGHAARGPAVLVKNEVASFNVLVQNPLEIELEVEEISLLTEDCDFQPQPLSILLAPLCLQTFTLTGMPAGTGSLKILGCKAQVKNCHEQNFTTFSGMWKPPQITKRKDPKSLVVDLPESATVELKVVDRLPQLQVSSTDLVQNSLMLLDGEKSIFSLTLENTGDIPADLVLFSYQDSASSQLQEALSSKDMQPTYTYELQHQLTTRPAIKRVLTDQASGSQKIKNSTSSIAAGAKESFQFEVVGKPGLTEVNVLIDYAHLGKPRNEIEEAFYTRQLRFTVAVTVNGSVDIPRCNLLAIPAASPHLEISETNGKAPSTFQNGHRSPKLPADSGHCLLQLDLRSIWQSPITFTVETRFQTIQNSDDGSALSEWEVATTSTLEPTLVERVLILVPRIYIPDPFAPIPSLDSNNRQFVVSASKLSLEAETASREAFWYRQELCRRLRITWKEERGHRSGDIDVRKGISLSARMIDVLRVEHVQISFDLEPSHTEDEGTVTTKGMSQFEVKRNVFAKLIVKVHNLTQEELKLLLRLQPSLHDQPHNLAMDLSKKFIWSGVLQSVLKGPLVPGEMRETELGIVALVNGVYEVNATVEEVRSRRRHLDGAPDVGANIERRIWHARRPCLIHSID